MRFYKKIKATFLEIKVLCSKKAFFDYYVEGRSFIDHPNHITVIRHVWWSRNHDVCRFTMMDYLLDELKFDTNLENFYIYATPQHNDRQRQFVNFYSPTRELDKEDLNKLLKRLRAHIKSIRKQLVTVRVKDYLGSKSIYHWENAGIRAVIEHIRGLVETYNFFFKFFKEYD